MKEYLSRKGVSFQEKDLQRDPSAIEDLRRLGAMATPVVVVDGEPVVGFDEERLNTLLGNSLPASAGA